MADTETGCTTIGSDAAIDWKEILFRIFRGDAALERVTLEAMFSCEGTPDSGVPMA